MKHKVERAGERVRDTPSHGASSGGGVRRRKRWRVRVVRIDARKYPQFFRDPDHPFISMAPEARIAEIDSFCARLWAQTVKVQIQTCTRGRIWSAAA